MSTETEKLVGKIRSRAMLKLKIKKLKKRVLKLKKRCKNMKKIVGGLQEQLDNVKPDVRIKEIEVLRDSIFGDITVDAGECAGLDGKIHFGRLVIALKKSVLRDLKIKTKNDMVGITLMENENPLDIYIQAEALADYLGVKVKDGGFQFVSKPENVVDVPTPKTDVTTITPPAPTKEKVTNEATANNVPGSVPKVPVQKGTPQQNPK